MAKYRFRFTAHRVGGFVRHRQYYVEDIECEDFESGKAKLYRAYQDITIHGFLPYVPVDDEGE